MTKNLEPKALIERLIPFVVVLSLVLFAIDGKLIWDQQHHHAAAPTAAAAHG